MSYTIRRFSIVRNPTGDICTEFYLAVPVDSPVIRTNQTLSPKSKNHGPLATPSETTCKEAPANPAQLRSVSRRVGPTTWCSRSDPLYEYFQVRTRQERTTARHPARLCSP